MASDVPKVGSAFDAVIDGDVIICHHQKWDVAAVDALLALSEQVLAKHRFAFAVMDFSRGIHMTPDARRRVAEVFRERKLDLFVVAGAGVVTRALVTLASQAMARLRGRPANTRFVANMAAARRLIDAERERLSAAAPAK